MGIALRELQHCNNCNSESKVMKKISCEIFENRNGNVVPSHRQFERNGTSLTARRPIARREKPKRSKWHERTINQFINQHKN